MPKFNNFMDLTEDEIDKNTVIYLVRNVAKNASKAASADASENSAKGATKDIFLYNIRALPRKHVTFTVDPETRSSEIFEVPSKSLPAEGTVSYNFLFPEGFLRSIPLTEEEVKAHIKEYHSLNLNPIHNTQPAAAQIHPHEPSPAINYALAAEHSFTLFRGTDGVRTGTMAAAAVSFHIPNTAAAFGFEIEHNIYNTSPGCCEILSISCFSFCYSAYFLSRGLCLLTASYLCANRPARAEAAGAPDVAADASNPNNIDVSPEGVISTMPNM